MDFSYLDASNQTIEATATPVGNERQPKAIKGGKQANRYKAGVVQQASAALMIPPAIGAKLSHLTQVYGLPFDIGQMSLQTATPENVKGFRTIVTMMENNSKLLPEMLKLVKKLLNADIKLAEYHSGVVKASIKHQESLDRETADIFAMMGKAAVKASKLEHRTNERERVRNKRDEAWTNYYSDSVVAAEMEVIDAEYTQLASNQKSLAASKTKKAEFKQQQADESRAYTDSAYE